MTGDGTSTDHDPAHQTPSILWEDTTLQAKLSGFSGAALEIRHRLLKSLQGVDQVRLAQIIERHRVGLGVKEEQDAPLQVPRLLRYQEGAFMGRG